MQTKTKYDRETIRIFWQATLQFKREFYLSLMGPLGAICLSMLVPLFTGKILAALALPGTAPEHYIPYLVAAGLAGVVFNRYGFAATLRLQAYVMNYLQTKAFNTLLRRSMGFHNNHIGGKLISDAIDFPNAYSALANGFFINFLPFSITLLVGTGLVFIESWKLGLVILVMAGFALSSGIIESRRRSGLRDRRLAASKKLTSHMADTIVNIQTVKTFAREDDELQNHTALGDHLGTMRISDWARAAYSGNGRIFVLLLMQLVFIFSVIYLVKQDPHLLGIGIFAFSFTITLSNRLFEINSMLRNIEDGFLNASPMTEIIMGEVEIKDAPSASPLKVTDGGINFNNTSFAYSDSKQHESVFDNLELAIKPGEKIGLVGPSGGGKSTLTRLLLRFDDVTGGSIAIDDQNIAEVTQVSLRQAISYVPQEPLLFHRSVADNIAYGNPNATLAQIKEAAKKAHADEFVGRLSDGYKTIVGERGVKLSGGQRQRIAIARAILKNAPILVLDEATSALDSESEVAIQDALWKLMEGRTAIVVAHRLSTIQKMDRILVLEDGRITEQGTHNELLKKKDGTYAKLWGHQSGGFMQD